MSYRDDDERVSYNGRSISRSQMDRIDKLDYGFCNPMKAKFAAEDEEDILAEDD